MIRKTPRSDSSLTRRKRTVLSAVAVVCIVLGCVALVAAQQTFSDDFEDGDVDGWDGQGMDVHSESVEGNWSLRATDGVDNGSVFPEWVAGPTINLDEEFTITGTSNIDQGTGVAARAGFGLIDGDGDGAMLLFSREFDSTFLAASGTGDFNESGDHYDTDFDETWVEWEVNSTGNGTLRAKVWEHGTPEPSSYDLQRDFGGGEGNMTVWTGTTNEGRVVLLDSVQITGEEVPEEDDEDLDLDVPVYMRHNQTAHYTVEANQSGTWVDVTADANISPENPDAVTFFPSNGTVHSTGNTSINVQFNVTADYQGFQDTEEMTVAVPTIENLDILPSIWRVNALFGGGLGGPNDPPGPGGGAQFQFILFALLAGVVAKGLANAFAGIGVMQLMLMVGWFAGWVTTGLMLACLAYAIFVALNLALNIDTGIG